LFRLSGLDLLFTCNDTTLPVLKQAAWQAGVREAYAGRLPSPLALAEFKEASKAGSGRSCGTLVLTPVSFPVHQQLPHATLAHVLRRFGEERKVLVKDSQPY
jgi:hypothetical protein